MLSRRIISVTGETHKKLWEWKVERQTSNKGNQKCEEIGDYYLKKIKIKKNQSFQNLISSIILQNNLSVLYLIV